MTYEVLKKLPEDYKGHWISVYLPIAGHKAVEYWWNPEGFWEPYQTGSFAYATKAEAVDDGKYWAVCDDLPFVDS